MKIIIAKDYKELSKKAALIIVEQIQKKPDTVLGLATGGTPIGLYKDLAGESKKGLVDFRKVTTFNLDEYIGLSSEHKESYRYFMNANLFNCINIRKQNTHVPDGSAEDLEGECGRYEKLIARAGGIDFQVLGIGHNGHIGFNEPGTSFQSATHVVRLADETIAANSRFFKSEDEVPREAITMGLDTIMKAKKILLLASGDDKANIVARAIEGRVSIRVPASILQKHKDVTVILDKSAAGKLKKREART